MSALKPRPSSHVLVMSEESGLGREAIATAYALKQLVEAGVRVFFYLEDRERTLDSPTDKTMLSLTAFTDDLEREKAWHRASDAMIRKARAGHVTGGRVPQQGRPAAWVSSSVRAVLRRPLYRGEIVWNQTRKRDGWRQANRIKPNFSPPNICVGPASERSVTLVRALRACALTASVVPCARNSWRHPRFHCHRSGRRMARTERTPAENI